MAHLHLRPGSASRNNSRASSRRRPGLHTRDSSLSNVLRVQAPQDLINLDAPGGGIDPEMLADVVDAPSENDELISEEEHAVLPWYKRPSAWWYVGTLNLFMAASFTVLQAPFIDTYHCHRHCLFSCTPSRDLHKIGLCRAQTRVQLASGRHRSHRLRRQTGYPPRLNFPSSTNPTPRAQSNSSTPCSTSTN